MNWLNYHHLLYFWTVVREGSVSKAAEKLRLAQPTVSAQVRMLEKALGQELFVKKGRTQLLTDVGRTVYRYADEIFGIGREMMQTLEGRSPGRAMPQTGGIA
jgi:LysR family transcriptional activator of nhaA